MIRLAVVCCGLLGATPSEGSKPPSPDFPAYEVARSKSGKGSAAQVELALWCEAHGLNAERMKHLTLAVLADPANAAARGLLGLVADGRGRWRRPEDVADRDRAGAATALAEYNRRREHTAGTAEAQWKLALWCEANGLKPEAVAHFTAVTRLDPSRASAWKHLGYKSHGGRWMTAEQIAAEAAEADAQVRADRRWRPVFARARGYLSFKDRTHQRQAEALLADVTDPRAVPSALAVLGSGPDPVQRMGVQLLGRIECPASSRALAVIAVRSSSDPARRAAAETLRRRDPRDFVHVLIARLRDPVTYHVRPVAGPGQPGELVVEGDGFNLDRVYNPPPLPAIPTTPGSSIGLDPAGSVVVNLATAIRGSVIFSAQLRPAVTNALLPRFSGLPLARSIANLFGANGGISALPFQVQAAGPLSSPDGTLPPATTPVPLGRMVTEILRAVHSSRVQLRNDVESLHRMNAEVRKANDPVVGMLAAVLGSSSGTSRSDWERWYNDRRGYTVATTSLDSRPTIVEEISPSYTPANLGRFRYDRQVGYYYNPDCFAAGTPVRTMDGPRAIESIKVGDRVLTQDPRTGALSYQPVLVVHHNPPSDVLKLDLGGEPVVTTGIQRFWKARHGWVMARDLKPGDSVRTVGGLARVDAVGSETIRPVFNLEVSGGHDFFVGAGGLLVHDHTEVQPLDRPFDSPADLTSFD